MSYFNSVIDFFRPSPVNVKEINRRIESMNDKEQAVLFDKICEFERSGKILSQAVKELKVKFEPAAQREYNRIMKGSQNSDAEHVNFGNRRD